ncbi:iron-containing alcohol dehydrogenase [Kitasatospora phosalacinea]|uniref:PhpC n=1 Tax=Kitasatospora phosalacinea TaxID=2065 RepID=A0A0M3N268_9ACTN|nr:iron-containing alcohol dehydrogenase [Kitasatospora phosalacinea]AKO69603.1 PhpC [Kitasatospora phosalacinea]
MTATRLLAEGPGAVAAVAAAVADLPARRGRRPRGVLVVGGGFASRDWAPGVRAALRPAGLAVLVHRGTTTPRSVAELAAGLRAERAEVVVALGGGSVLDAAKAAAVLAAHERPDADLVVARCLGRTPATGPGIPVIAVPTTAGTGAEATPFATVWDLARGRKLSLAGSGVRPLAAVLDPDLLAGLDRNALAAGVLDTLCQAVEAAWSIRSGPESTAWGLRALGQAAPALDRAAAGTPGAAERLALQRAGHASGQAIALAQTSSCHAVSYALTLRLGLSHGHACGVALGPLLRHNAAVTEADCADPRGTAHVRRLIADLAAPLGGSPAEAAARVEGFLAGSGLARLDELPVSAEEVAADALSYPRCHDNPRRLSHDSLSRLLADRSATEEMCG